MRRTLTPLVLVGLVATLVVASSVSSQVPVGGYPSAMPSTPMPSIKGCSSSQRAYLEKAWRLAHYTTWRTERTFAFIQSQPSSEREALWNRDYVAGDGWSPSPRRWFGRYDSGNAAFVRTALDKAEKRFRMQGDNVKGIKTLRCGTPGVINDKNVDGCPSGNPGGDGAPTAYHFPIGTVVTCPSFWNGVNNQFEDPDVRLISAASVLVHEIFHWLSVDRKYVTDHHGDGVGGHKDQKYYGLPNVTYLAENARTWATRNNDTYRFLTRGMGNVEPRFTGTWARKDPGGSGALYYDMSWDGLVARWKELAGKGQYLADVETYVRDGKRRYAGLWRVGPGGNAALYAATADKLVAHWHGVKAKQDLIDIEVYKSGSSWVYIGVYRAKVGRTTPPGLVRFGLGWNDLVRDWNASGSTRYLADVEPQLLPTGTTYIAVFLPGSGNGSLLQSNSWTAFSDYKKSRDGKEQLLDVERWIEGGKWKTLGVWRASSTSGQVKPDVTVAELVAEWSKQASQATLVDLEEYSVLPLRVP